MADTPAPLPSLGLLDGLGSSSSAVDSPAFLPSMGLLGGLGTAPSSAVDSPAFLPSMGLLGGLGSPAIPAAHQLVHDFPIPLHWYADPGFSAAYAFQPVGVSVANRDDAIPPQRVVRLYLTSDFSAAYPASTAWHYALHASADPALWSAPLMQGNDGSIDAAGDFLLNVESTALAAGDMPGLVLTDGTTDATLPIIAFVGPVLVTEE